VVFDTASLRGDLVFPEVIEGAAKAGILQAPEENMVTATKSQMK